MSARNRKVKRHALLGAVTVAVAAAATAYAGGTELDRSFSGDGKVTTDFGGADPGRGVAIQDDGKIVVAGSTNARDINGQYDFALARYNADGTLDSSFSGDGTQVTDIGGSDEGTAVALQDDGKIVVAGTTSGPFNSPTRDDFAVARYNPDGTLDTSFSNDGKQTTDFGEDDSGNALAIQENGRIVIAGTAVCLSDDQIEDCTGDFGLGRTVEFILARYLPDGSLDRSFSGDGRQTTDFPGSGEGTSLALQEGAGLVVGGEANGNFALARYQPSGALDPTFSQDGRQTTDFTGGFDSGEDLVVQENDKLVLAGFTVAEDNDFALARYGPNGHLDRSFSDDGRQTTDLGRVDFAEGVALQDDGMIVLAGASRTLDHAFDPDFALVRYRRSGSLESSRITQFGTFPSIGWEVAVHDDGRIVVGGEAGPFQERDFGLARYDPQRLPRCAGDRATIVGTGERDILTGTAGRDVIVAGAGADRVEGRRKGDAICAGAGEDVIVGEAGPDLLLGQAGGDRLLGGKGRDDLRGGAGRDSCRGGPGRDDERSC